MKMSRRTILKAGAGTALALAGLTPRRRGKEPGHDADPRRHRVHRAAHDGARARARLEGHALQSRQARCGRRRKRRDAPRRPQGPARVAAGPQVGRRRRQHRLHPEVHEDVGGPARAEHRLLPLHLEHLGLRELREAERHRLADRRAREQGPGRDHERDLRADEGALRAVRARRLRQALLDRASRATSWARSTRPTASPTGRCASPRAATWPCRGRPPIPSRSWTCATSSRS